MDSDRMSKMLGQSTDSLSIDLKVRELENQIRRLKEDKADMEQLELAQFELNERMEQIELSQPKAGFLRQKSSVSVAAVDGKIDPEMVDQIIDTLRDHDIKMNAISKEIQNYSQIKTNMAEIQKKMNEGHSNQEVLKLTSKVEEFEKMTKSIHGEIKLMKDQLGEFPKISRQIASLQRGPNETDMTKMRERLDIIEGNQTNFKRKIGEIDKKQKEELENAENKVDFTEDIAELK